jgi:hypothetical protein
MVLPRASCTIIFAASLLSLGCRRHHRHEVDEVDVPLSDAQKAVVIAATNHLQDQLNRGACQSIYDESSTGFHSQTPKDWLRECTMLQSELGAWNSFQPKYTDGNGERVLVVLVYGQAEFEKEKQQVEINWILNEKGAQLLMLGLRRRDDEQWIQIPPRPGRSIDPPPIKSPQTPAAS